MSGIKPCLCGAMPLVEKGVGKFVSGDGEAPTEKFRCPNCANKELPFLDARGSFPDSAREWNRIASEKNYRKRTLEYNMHGVCVDEPYKEFSWRDKKKAGRHVTVTFFLDNGMYYYRYSFLHGNEGSHKGLWISDPGFPSMDAAKKAAARTLAEKNESVAGIVKNLLLEPEQGELF
jgi:hypothetical protein